MSAQEELRDAFDKPGSKLVAGSTLLTSATMAAYMSTLVVYLRQQDILSNHEIGFTFTIAAIAAPLLGIVTGRMCDRFSPRPVVVVVQVFKALTLVPVAFVDSAATATTALVAAAVADQSAIVAQSAFIGTILEGQTRQRFSAILRSVFNVGFVMGTAAGGLFIALGVAQWQPRVVLSYALVSGLIGVAFFFAAPPTTPRANRPTTWALQDFRYIGLAVYTGVVGIADTALVVGLPLVIVTATSVPPSFAAWLLGMNAVLVILLQLRVAGGVDNPATAIRSMRLASLAGAVACLLMATTIQASDHVDWLLILLLLTIVMTVLTISELHHASGAWWYRFNARRDMAQGDYGAVFSLGGSAGKFLGPAAVAATAGAAWGWVGLGVGFACLGAGAQAVSRWASVEDSRPDRALADS